MPHEPAGTHPMEDVEYQHLANTEPIPGYRLLEPLGRGGFGEVWKCEAPGGLLKAIKFVTGGMHVLDTDAPADEELRAIQHVKAIRHPFMLTMERVEVVDRVLVIVMELADKSLADVLDAQRAAGKPGIPRDALLLYLREAAEVLDVMNTRHQLQHLDIKPRNLFLVSNHVKVGDFGLVNTLTSSAGSLAGCSAPGAVTPLYASPEVFQGRISRHSDQYSLAIVFQELLTGSLPFNGKNSRQLLIQHTQGVPNLAGLSQADAAIVARALSKDPDARFPSCSDLVNAIALGETEVVSSTILTNVPANEADTQSNPAARTPRSRTASVRPPSLPPEVLGGIQVRELVSRTPLTEVWRATNAQGAARLVKVLFGCRSPGDESIGRLQKLRHPLLLPIDVLHHGPGRLVLSTPPGDRNLREVLADFQGQGLPGMPRADLLACLRVVAEGLHHLATSAGLFHLALNPRSLVLDDGRIGLADFGLSQLVWQPAGQALALIGGRYAAPELAGQPGAGSDQYSLALVYHELLTGAFPSPSPSPRKGEPPTLSLDRLPEADRVIIAKALSPDPRKRWDSVLDFIKALESTTATAEATPLPTGAPTRVLPAIGSRRLPVSPAGEVVQTTRFGTSLSAATITQRLEGFRQQWSVEVVTGEVLSAVYKMQTPSSFWQRWTGKRPGLEIRLQITPPDMTAPEGVQLRTELRMDLHPRDCSKEQGGDMLEAVGPLLVESIRAHLQVNPRGRAQERLVWHHPLRLCSILPDGTQGPSIECQGKDISLNGIGFYLPGQLPSSSVMLLLPRTPQTPLVSKRARIVRIQGCGDGWYEVGAVLLPPDDLPSDKELYGDQAG
jgi:serine/threonine protein kinase